MESKQKITNRSQKNFWVVFILWLFTGYLGGHRIYVGRGSWLYSLTLGYLLIGWMIDLIFILLNGFKDKQGLLVSMPESILASPKKRWIATGSLLAIVIIFYGGASGANTGDKKVIPTNTRILEQADIETSTPMTLSTATIEIPSPTSQITFTPLPSPTQIPPAIEIPSQTSQITFTTLPSPTQIPPTIKIPSPTSQITFTPLPLPTQIPPTIEPANTVTIIVSTLPLVSSGCPNGCTQQQPGCAIKGNINSSGEKIYHVPGGAFYDKTIIDPSQGERWFCTAAEAVSNGWRPSQR